MKKTISTVLAVIMIAAMFTVFAVPSSASLLPAEYVQLEYAESDGNEQILTEIYPSPRIRLECDFQYVDTECPFGSASVTGVVGTYMSGSAKSGRFQLSCSKKDAYFSIGMGQLFINSSNPEKSTPADSAAPFTYTPFDKDKERHIVVMDAPNGTISMDNVVLGQISADKLGLIDESDPTNGSKLPPFILFGSNQATGHGNMGKSAIGIVRVCSCRFYESDKLIADFVPCFRISDKMVGMYETVEGKFYINALYDDISLLADPAILPPEEPTTEEATTEAPKTEAPKSTEAQKTDAPTPVTDAPITDAPKTDAPVTDAPKTDGKKGCSGSAAMIGIAVVMTLGCAVIHRKEN